jgi:hypothetical protein
MLWDGRVFARPFIFTAIVGIGMAIGLLIQQLRKPLSSAN